MAARRGEQASLHLPIASRAMPIPGRADLPIASRASLHLSGMNKSIKRLVLTISVGCPLNLNSVHVFTKQVQGRNQDLNLAKQKYKILTGHKNRC